MEIEIIPHMQSLFIVGYHICVNGCRYTAKIFKSVHEAKESEEYKFFKSLTHE